MRRWPSRMLGLMATAEVRLDTGDAGELAELLAFVSDWLSSEDAGLLSASLGRFIGSEARGGYDVAELRADLARFVLLLGGVDGERLFGGPDSS